MASLNVTPSQPLTSGAIFFICKGGNMQWLTNPIGSGYYFLRFYHNKSNWPERNCLVEVSRLGNYSYVDQVPEYKEYKEEDIEENEFKTKEAPAGSLWYGPLKAPEFTEKEKKLKAAAQDKIYWKKEALNKIPWYRKLETIHIGYTTYYLIERPMGYKKKEWIEKQIRIGSTLCKIKEAVVFPQNKIGFILKKVEDLSYIPFFHNNDATGFY